ncbi:hypothetical protein MSG28_005375 [Choristoneura fumiferana]|uniref:Uncharacterized protein n=1 Tax=Choristoneura fumiferana TaxID=7141 RepID=A0ACC0JR13_CHOFU|nr:hypothetical protein MSG28_005375 [Choristoneura fumiferana]
MKRNLQNTFFTVLTHDSQKPPKPGRMSDEYTVSKGVWVARLSNGYYKVIIAVTTIASFYVDSDLFYDKISSLILDHLQRFFIIIVIISQKTSTVGYRASKSATMIGLAPQAFIELDYEFAALAVETMGPWSADMKAFMGAMSSRLIETSGDPRAGAYLSQRISLTVKRDCDAVLTMCFFIVKLMPDWRHFGEAKDEWKRKERPLFSNRKVKENDCEPSGNDRVTPSCEFMGNVS